MHGDVPRRKGPNVALANFTGRAIRATVQHRNSIRWPHFAVEQHLEVWR